MFAFDPSLGGVNQHKNLILPPWFAPFAVLARLRHGHGLNKVNHLRRKQVGLLVAEQRSREQQPISERVQKDAGERMSNEFSFTLPTWFCNKTKVVGAHTHR